MPVGSAAGAVSSKADSNGGRFSPQGQPRLVDELKGIRLIEEAETLAIHSPSINSASSNGRNSAWLTNWKKRKVRPRNPLPAPVKSFAITACTARDKLPTNLPGMANATARNSVRPCRATFGSHMQTVNALMRRSTIFHNDRHPASLRCFN